ncbi:hypothetical protein PR048_018072 [Dryococelus australis]|uniref:Uncharacterized protein n=1 Tax=Dryococelus australis TaxID=614101 RepID=A0ABQ9HBU2_9NEOP|nr:hypothetical protein PR048_018072 [Dryococelus australis]
MQDFVHCYRGISNCLAVVRTDFVDLFANASHTLSTVAFEKATVQKHFLSPMLSVLQMVSLQPLMPFLVEYTVVVDDSPPDDPPSTMVVLGVSLRNVGAGLKEWGKREIPEKTRRPTASFGTILTYKNLNGATVAKWIDSGSVEREVPSGAVGLKPMRVNLGEYGAAPECKGGENGRSPRKARRPIASCGMFPTCENPGATPPGIGPSSPWWEASGCVAFGFDPLQQRLDVATTNVVAHIVPTSYVPVHSPHHTWCPVNLLCSDHNSCQQIFLCLYRITSNDPIPLRVGGEESVGSAEGWMVAATIDPAPLPRPGRTAEEYVNGRLCQGGRVVVVCAVTSLAEVTSRCPL